MQREGPELESLLHRLADCPPEFLQVAADKKTAGPGVVAIACDVLRPLTPERPPELDTSLLTLLQRLPPPQLALISIVCWLVADAWFQARPQLAPAIWKLLASDEFAKLTALVRPEKFVSDADRREELVRLCLSRLGLRPQGESPAQAADRLSALDTVERQRVLHATAAAERRAREIREAMALKKAQESASRYGE